MPSLATCLGLDYQKEEDTVTRFPSPFAALTQLFARAFTILGDRDGAGGRSAFVVGVSRSKPRRSSRAPASQAQDAATPNGPDPLAQSSEESATPRRRRFTDAPWASIDTPEPERARHATRNE